MLIIYSEFIELPRRLFYAWNLAFIGKLPKANTAEVEVAHIATLSTTAKAT